MRHERLHARRKESPKQPSKTSVCTSEQESTRLNGGLWPEQPDASHSETIPTGLPLPNGITNDSYCTEQQFTTSENVNLVPDTGLDFDFDFMWPDSVDLFQTITSQDTANQWQMPLGTLPYPIDQPLNAYNENIPRNNASPSSPDDHFSLIGVIPPGENYQAVHGVSNMVTNLSSRMIADVQSTPITSVFLDECLHMFFARFIPTFPVLHRATFVFRECMHPLLLNAIAIGSLYLGPKAAIPKGEVLWRLAHTATATSWQTLITRRGPYDQCDGVQLVVTALLGQVYGALSMNRAIRTASQAFKALGFFWARHCGMFGSAGYSWEGLPPLDGTEAEKDQAWRAWVAREIQQRALLGHYVLDGLIAQMTGEPTSVRHAANQLHLPSTDLAFEAETSAEWVHQMDSSRKPKTSFRSLLGLLFSPGADITFVEHKTSTFTIRVLLEGIQSVISDCDESSELVLGVPSRAEVRTALSRIYESIADNIRIAPEARLETMLRWHGVCLEAMVDSSLLGKYVCSRCNIEQHVWADAGPKQPERDIIRWATTEDARRALLHATAIQDIVELLPRGRAHTMHMPSTLFAACTVYIVFILADLVTIRFPNPIDWKVALCDDGDDTSVPSMTRNYVRYQRLLGDGNKSGTIRNLLYELSSIQKLFACLSTQWGIARDMEKVVDKWVTLCH